MWLRGRGGSSPLQSAIHSNRELSATMQLETAKLVGGHLVMNDSSSVIFSVLAVKVGLGCLLAQCVLYVVFKSGMPKGSTWSTAPSYTAHQVIVLPLMINLVLHGTAEWFFSNEKQHDSTAEQRIVQGSCFSDLIVGIMVWDIPVTLLTPQLRNLPMMLHHVAMLVTASLSLGVWSDGKGLFGYYAPFFFGISEISTLPLVVMDLMTYKGLASPAWLGPLFAFLFLTVRAIYFPYVSVTRVLPDIKEVTSKGIYPKALHAMAVLNVLFTLLQLYWGALVVQELVKLATSGTTTG